MADIDRVQLLIGLSNNMRTENEEWRRQVHREGVERAKRVLDMIAMFEQEYAALDSERNRLAQYIPRQVDSVSQQRAEQMPKVVTQGPKS